jgi:hypothetical protein
MTKLDDTLRRDLDRIATPADPSGVVEAIERRARRRGRIRRAGSAVLAIVVVVSTVAGVGLLRRAFAPVPTPPAGGTSASVEPTPETSPTATATALPGLAAPMCTVSAMQGSFGGPTPGTWFVATVASDGKCPAPGRGSGIVAVDANGDDTVDTSTRIDCVTACEAMAAPDIDGDGVSELVVSVGPTDAAARYELFTNIEPGIEPLAFDCANCGAPTFTWGGPDTDLAGAYCLPRHDGPDLVSWTAHETDDGAHYDVEETTIDVTGSLMTVVDRWTSTVPFDRSALPPGGGETFCGERVFPPTA